MRKQRISVGLLTIAACLLFVQQVYAAGSVSATASTETIAVSEQVSVTIKAENPQGAAEKPEITVEYDPKVLQFDSCDKNCGGGGGGLLTLNDTEAVITFTGIADGTANVKVSAILDGDGANVPTGAATITVGAGGTASDAAMPVSADGITDTGIADGLIAIGDNSKMLSTTFPNELLPAGFHKEQFNYKEQMVEAAKSDTGALTLLYLTDESGANADFCIYDQTADAFTEFVSIKGIEGRYIVIMPLTDDIVAPDGFTKATLQWNNKSLHAFMIADSADKEATEGAVSKSDFFLLYAMNNEGTNGWYLYDMKEGTYQRYLQLSSGSVSDAGGVGALFSTDSGEASGGVSPIILIVMGVVLVILLALVIILFVKLREYQGYEYIDEDDDDEDEDEDEDEEDDEEEIDQETIRARRYEAGEELEDTGEIYLNPHKRSPILKSSQDEYRNELKAENQLMQEPPKASVGYETTDMYFEQLEPLLKQEEQEEPEPEKPVGRKEKKKKEKKKSRLAQWYESDDLMDDDEEDAEDDQDVEDDAMEEPVEEKTSLFGHKKKKKGAEPVEATQMDWSKMQEELQNRDDPDYRHSSRKQAAANVAQTAPVPGAAAPGPNKRVPVTRPNITVTEPPKEPQPKQINSPQGRNVMPAGTRVVPQSSGMRPDMAVQPGMPVQSGMPVQPGMPVQRARINQPVQAGIPRPQPGMGGQPAAQRTPHQGITGTSGMADAPRPNSMPVAPGVPRSSGMPISAGVSGQPVMPGQPIMPGQPNMSGMPRQPIMPGAPRQTGVPGQPVMPGAPRQVGMPGQSGQPVMTGVPRPPQAPASGNAQITPEERPKPLRPARPADPFYEQPARNGQQGYDDPYRY